MTQTAKIIQFSRPRMEQEDASAPDAGFIKLYRTLQDSAFSGRPEYLSSWVHILMLASHKPRQAMIGNKSVLLHAGQFISGRKALSERIGITEKQMRGVLDFFESEGMITKESSRAGTIFTVCNYSIFQEKKGQEGPTVSGQQKGQAEASKYAASSESGANEKANKGPTKRATTQEHNNISISNDIDNAHECAAPDPLPTKRKPSVQKEFTTTLINKGVSPELAEEYAKVRKAKRMPLSEGALKLLEREAAKAGQTLAAALETCVLRGWGGFKAQWLENEKRQNSGRSSGAWVPDHSDTSWADGFRPFEEPF